MRLTMLQSDTNTSRQKPETQMLGMAKPAPNSSTLQPLKLCRTAHRYSASSSEAPHTCTPQSPTLLLRLHCTSSSKSAPGACAVQRGGGGLRATAASPSSSVGMCDTALLL